MRSVYFLSALLLFSINLAWGLPDPMRPAVHSQGVEQTSASAQAGTLSLQAIFKSAAQSRAMINQQVVAEGSQMGNYTVVRIQDHAVTLSRAGKQTVLQLDPLVVKQTHRGRKQPAIPQAKSGHARLKLHMDGRALRWE